MTRVLMLVAAGLALFGSWRANAQTAVVQFAGQTWLVRTWGQNEDPGPNFWATNGVWVDAISNLHLRIHQAGGTNFCAELVSTNSFGYGRYIWFVSNRVDLLASNVVAGLFTYAPPWGANEIDIEFTRSFDDSGTNNLVYSVQPYYLPGHQRRFSVSLTNGPSTHTFTWLPGRVSWKSWHGWSLAPSNPAAVLAEYTYVGADVPTAGAERVHMNLWLYEGEPPGTGLIEMVIGDFRFEPIQPVLFADDFETPGTDPQWEVTGLDHSNGLLETAGFLQIEPADADFAFLGYRSSPAFALPLNERPYEFSARLRGFEWLELSTQSWAEGGQSVQAVMAVISGPVFYDVWNASNAIAVRATYTTNDDAWVELTVKTNALYTWGSVVYAGLLPQMAQYNDASGVEMRLVLDATNYLLQFIRGTNLVPLLYPQGAASGPHLLGTSLSVSSHVVLAAANVADGRGRVIWESVTGRVFAPSPPAMPPPDLPGPNEVEIFDAAYTGVWRPPFDTSRNKARLLCLFRADEIGRDGLITALAVRVESSPGIPLSNFTIRLQHTTASSVPAWPAGGWATAFVGQVQGLVTGWHYFAFQTPFAYDGSRHLLVDFSFNNVKREAAPLGFTRKVLKTGSRSRLAVSNTGNPLTWTTPAGTTTNALPAVRFALAHTNMPSTNLLLNPDFEAGPTGEDNVPDHWWTYGGAARFSWAGYQGNSYGMAFKNWWPGAFGGFGQDVPVAAQPGDAFLFSIRGARDPHFASASSNVWLLLEAISTGGATNAYLIRPIYNQLMASPPHAWTTCQIGFTNTSTNTTMIRVSVHFADGTDDTNGYRAVKWDDAELVKWYVPLWQANSAYGVPLWWLQQHGLLPSHLTAADVEALDHDQDGLASWQEFIAGTDPTNPASRFAFSHLSATGLTAGVRLQWPSAEDRLYAVDEAPAVTGPYVNISGTLAPTPPLNVYTSAWSSATARFYRVRAWLP